MMEWQPIDTAPKDGGRFLGYMPCDPIGFDDWSMVDCWWCVHRNQWETPYLSDEKPTHWMPLPAPPSN